MQYLGPSWHRCERSRKPSEDRAFNSPTFRFPVSGQRRPDSRREGRRLRNRSAHLSLGRMGARSHPSAVNCRPRVYGDGRRHRSRRACGTHGRSPFRPRGTLRISRVCCAARVKRTFVNTSRLSASTGDGAFAEYIAMPEYNVWKLDPAIPDTYAAILDPFGNAVHTVMAAGVSVEERGDHGRRRDSD